MIGSNFFTKLNEFVDVAFDDKNGYAFYAKCIGNPTTVAIDTGIYAHGCLMVQTDTAIGSPSVYENIGSLDTPNWQPIATGSTTSGITTLNGLTATTQTFTTGTTGTDFNISSTGSVHTFNIPDANTTNRGLLTSADYITFFGKENVLTFTSPLSRSGNTISIPQSNTSTSGYLSFTDWNTFNNKIGSVSSTNSIQLTKTGSTLSADLKISATVPNLATITTDGLLVQAPQKITQAFNNVTGTSITLTNSPAFVYGVYLQGQRLRDGIDYTIMGTALTLVNSLLGGSLDNIDVVYEF